MPSPEVPSLRWLAVVGSREYPLLSLVDAQIWRLRHSPDCEGFGIISGESRGVDLAAKSAALRYRFPYEGFPADWTTYGKRAGMIRNGQMALRCACCWAFWDGRFTNLNGAVSGTLNMVSQVRTLGKPVRLWGPDGEDIKALGPILAEYDRARRPGKLANQTPSLLDAEEVR